MGQSTYGAATTMVSSALTTSVHTKNQWIHWRLIKVWSFFIRGFASRWKTKLSKKFAVATLSHSLWTCTVRSIAGEPMSMASSALELNRLVSPSVVDLNSIVTLTALWKFQQEMSMLWLWRNRANCMSGETLIWALSTKRTNPRQPSWPSLRIKSGLFAVEVYIHWF